MKRNVILISTALLVAGIGSLSSLSAGDSISPYVTPYMRALLRSADAAAWTALGVRPGTNADRIALGGGLHLNQVFDVRDYGAAGNGSADDSRAIADALAAAQAAGGGMVYFSPGTYHLNSATLAALPNAALAVTADNITIAGAGREATKLVLTGRRGCGLFYASNVNNLCLQDLTYIGNGVQARGNDAGFLYYAATADANGLTVERCRIEDCNATGWINVVHGAGSHDLAHIYIRDNWFISRLGNIPGNGGTGVAADAIRLYDTTAADGGIGDIDIANNYCEGTYLKKFVSLFHNCHDFAIHHNEAWNVGLYNAMDSVQNYAVCLYNGPHDGQVFANRIFHPWTCGFYVLDGYNLDFADNLVHDQKDVADARLPTGAYALNAAYNVTIRGGTIADCNNAIEIVCPTYHSNIIIDAVNILDTAQANGGIVIREYANRRNVGGVTISNCRLRDTNIRLKMGSGAYNVGNVTITGNTIERGHIHLVGSGSGSLHDLIVSGNSIYATDETYGLYLSSVEGATITGNRLYGPGVNQAFTYGMRIVSCPLGIVITDNLITGFYNGIQGQYTSATFRSNTIVDCTEPIENSVAGDLGRENPATIPGTVATYWRRGQIVESPYVSAAGNAQGWMCVAPTKGLGCTYTTTTTADMTSGERVITDIAAIAYYIPGVQLTLANAAAGRATLTTKVLSWQVPYSGLRGTFLDREPVEDTTTAAFGTIQSDRGSVLQLTNVLNRAGTFTTGNTIRGCRSGATATIGAIGLTVADACGNTVNDQTLSLVAPSFVALPAHGPYAVSHNYNAGTTAWTMTTDEATGTLFTVTNANGPANAVFPTATAGKIFMIYNNSGQNITFKVMGQAGSPVADGKYAIFTMNATDCVELYEQP